MTEADKKNYEIISKDFNGNEIDFIEKKEDIWITSEALGVGLEYKNPRISIMKLYSSHQDELEEHSSVIELVTEAGKRETTVFSEMGAYLLIMFSNQPIAKKFRKWVVKVVKEIRKTGSYIEKVDNPYDLFIKQAENIKQIWIGLKEQNNELLVLKSQVNSVDSGLKTFEKKYEDEKLITPQTKKKITDMVHLCVLNSGKHYNKFYKKIWDKFGIRSTTGISEKLGQKIVDWMQNDPFFQYFIKKKENREV